jgi:hypothetical protein
MPENAVEQQEELFQEALAPEPQQAPEPEPQPPPPSAEPPRAPVEEGIPSWRLREEAEARRGLEEQNRQLAGRLQQYEAHLRRQQPQQAPDFFEAPERAVAYSVQQALAQHLQPFFQQQQQAQQAQHQALLHYGRSVAEFRHGEDKVKAAEDAFLQAYQQRMMDPMDFQRVVGAPNRYDAVVQWHQRHTALSTVGTDPNAWFEKELEARMADPKFQSSMMEKVRGKAGSRPADVRLPPSLSRAPASAGNGAGDLGDLSNASLWSHAMSK